MATTPNQKPVPSEDYANMRFNAGKFDEFVTSTESTYIDRLGQEHMTAEGIRASADDLRSDLASSDVGQGASLVKTNKSRTAQDKFNEDITPADYQAVGNGVTNDDEAFANLEIDVNGKEIDLCGLAYFVSNVPIGNKYYNGQWVIPTSSLPSAYINVIRSWDFPNNLSGPSGGGLAIGTGSAANIPDLSTANPSQSFIAIGRDALGNSTRGRSCIAIGAGTMSKASPGFANIAIGDFSLQNVAGTSSAAAILTGSRNIAIGSLAGHFIDSGFINVLIGRDSGHSITSGQSNTGIGYRALSCGYAPIGLSGIIENQYQVSNSSMTAVGESSLSFSKSDGNNAFGRFAGRYVKTGGFNTLIGTYAGQTLDYDLSENSKVISNISLSGSYSQTLQIITVNAISSGAVTGNKVGISFTTGGISSVTTDMQWITVTSVIDVDNFTITSPVSLSASGSCIITMVETSATRTNSSTNTVLGVEALGNSTSSQGGVVIGWQAGIISNGSNNVLVGQRSGYNLTTGSTNTCLGTNAGRGTAMAAFSNFTSLGANSVVTASNQCQIGDSATTTYVHGTVQNRSDIRDKADWRDPEYSLEFVRGLRAREYRWDMREDYVTVDDEGNVTRNERDGTKKRERFHTGYIAQEVKELCDKLGVDFGGYQDHSITGGCDVLSLGYDEFIPHVQKAVAMAWDKLDELESRIAKLESKK